MQWSPAIYVGTPASLLLNVALFRFILPVAINCPSVIYGKRINSFAGPYITYGELNYDCESSGASLPWRVQIRYSHFNPLKPKELQTVTGNITAKEGTIDDKSWVKVIIDKRSNNAWKENAFIIHFKDRGCSSFMKFMPGFYDVFFAEKMRGKSSCIIEPGIYAANQKPINWTFPDVPIMPYGRYRMRVNVGIGRRMYLCHAIDGVIIPKP